MTFERYRETVRENLNGRWAGIKLNDREEDFIHVSFGIITATRCATLISLGAVA